MNIRPGSIGYIMHHDSWISKAIAWFMDSEWGHTFGIGEKGKYATYIHETNEFNVWTGTLERYLGKDTVDLVIYSPIEQVSDEDCDKAVKKWISLQGLVYGYLQFISLGIRCLVKKLTRGKVKTKNFIRQGLVCCHVVAYGWAETDVPGFGDVDPESMDTEDHYQYVKNSQHFEKVLEIRRGKVVYKKSEL